MFCPFEVAGKNNKKYFGLFKYFLQHIHYALFTATCEEGLMVLKGHTTPGACNAFKPIIIAPWLSISLTIA
jgi:hypothetical protein